MTEKEYFKLMKAPRGWRLEVNNKDVWLKDNHKLMQLLRKLIYN